MSSAEIGMRGNWGRDGVAGWDWLMLLCTILMLPWMPACWDSRHPRQTLEVPSRGGASSAAGLAAHAVAQNRCTYPAHCPARHRSGRGAHPQLRGERHRCDPRAVRVRLRPCQLHAHVRHRRAAWVPTRVMCSIVKLNSMHDALHLPKPPPAAPPAHDFAQQIKKSVKSRRSGQQACSQAMPRDGAPASA